MSKATAEEKAKKPAEEQLFENDKPTEIKTIRIESAEQWPKATEIKAHALLSTVSGRIKFPIRAISHGERIKINEQTPMPTPPEVRRGRIKVQDDTDPKYLREVAAMEMRRYVATIDLCAMKLPGDSIDEKLTFIEQNIQRPGDVLNLYLQILRLSGYESGEKVESDGEILIAKPEDWINASKAPSIYAFRAPGFIYEFVLKGVSGTRLKQIDAATDPGAPPVQFIPDPSGSRRGVPQPNPEAPAYKRKIADCTEQKNMMILESGLTFQIPGDSMAQKQAWMNDRAAFHVLGLHAYMQNDVMSYRTDVDFS